MKRVQGPEPKTPIDGASPPPLAERVLVPEPVHTVPAEVETPRAASISRFGPDMERPGNRGRGLRWRSLPISTRVGLAVAGGMTAIFAAFLAPAWRRAAASSRPVSAAVLAGAAAGLDVAPVDDDRGITSPDDSGADAAPARPPPPGVWRVSELGSDDAVSLLHETVGHRSVASILAAARVPRTAAERVTDSLARVRPFSAIGAREELTLAIDKTTSHVVAFELASSPADVWQGREDAVADGGPTLFVTRKLDLPIERVRLGVAVVVGADLRASIAEAGLTPLDDVLAIIDDALEGHAELSDIRPGSRLRLLGTQDQVAGRVLRWVSLDAVEYFPAGGSGIPVRVYGAYDGEPDFKKHRGWYDAKGRQPFHGGFRTPVPLARIASRFNPHRMHPVLHVVMPHNGVDFAAPIGAPVYATAAGTVTSVGPDGPCGNKVEISHPSGIASVYCHLSRFAQGLRMGAHVEQRQLIAYVGQTGRVTGPHLHFGIRRNGVFVDPMTLRLDSVRVVPRALREDFDRRRSELDKELDGIPLPALGAAPIEIPEPETSYEDP